jgi:hypothetical protein
MKKINIILAQHVEKLHFMSHSVIIFAFCLLCNFLPPIVCFNNTMIVLYKVKMQVASNAYNMLKATSMFSY